MAALRARLVPRATPGFDDPAGLLAGQTPHCGPVDILAFSLL